MPSSLEKQTRIIYVTVSDLHKLNKFREDDISQIPNLKLLDFSTSSSFHITLNIQW